MAETIFDKPLADPPFYNGLDKTVGGFALDARQGKALSDQLTSLNSNIENLIGTYPLPKSNFVTWFTIYKGTNKWHFVPLLGASRKTISIVSCMVGGQSLPCTLEARLDGGIIVITTWTAGDIENAVLTLSIS